MRSLDFLRLRITRDAAVVNAYRRPVGFQQIKVPNSAIKLTVPLLVVGVGVVGEARIYVEAAAVRYRDDGIAPTQTVGMVILKDETFVYNGDFATIQFIAASAVTPFMNISYYV